MDTIVGDSMKMNLVLELSDTPGQLVNSLEPFSELGANLVSVIHDRTNKNENGKIPVQITVEGERQNLEKIIETLESNGIRILEVDGSLRTIKVSTILIGHIIDTDVRDTVDKLNELENVTVVGMEIKFNNEERSSGLITVETALGLKNTVLNKIREIANTKDLLVINEV